MTAGNAPATSASRLGFDRDQAKGTLAALGVKNTRPLNSNGIHIDDPFGYDVQISGLDETAFTRRRIPLCWRRAPLGAPL